MGNFALIFGLLVAVLLVVDWYVYKHWKAFLQTAPRLRWTRPFYLVFMYLMPAALPVYFYFSRWWEVEPKLFRALFIGFFALYYLPKFVIAIVLGLKDLGRLVFWLFRWFQEQLGVTSNENPADAEQLDLTDMKRLSRREFLGKIGWSASTVPYVVTGYGVFRTLYDFNVQRIDIPLPNLPSAFDGIRIVQLSDIHAGSFFSQRPMLEVADIIGGIKPDVIAITGDFVNNNDEELIRIMPALNGLDAPLGVYGCLGNHDHYANTPLVIDRLRNSPINLLVNARQTIALDGERLHLLGTDNTGFNQQYADLPLALEGIENPEDLHILLAHDPTFWDNHVRPNFQQIDLMLCGHTHGGQVGIEVGPLRWSLARFMYSRWAGLYTEPREPTGQQQFLYVNRGLGTVGPPLRFGIRPEITELTLRRV
ncbi:MAG: metallophosphoesterase [Bacteroidota bacterium]